MRKIFLLLAVTIAFSAMAENNVQMLAYARENGEGGLRLAWRADSAQEWVKIGSFVNSDFGPWGIHKKMWQPVLEKVTDGWKATWIADQEGRVLATALSSDLKNWLPQTYSVAEPLRDGFETYQVAAQPAIGNIVEVDMALIDDLRAHVDMRNGQNSKYSETMSDDPERFANLRPLTLNVSPQPDKAKKISQKLMGIFFEDINYGADGGLYAELVQNRDFEYAPSDRGNDPNWNALTAWAFPEKNRGKYSIATADPIHPNNPHYLAIVAKDGFKIVNEGYDGIPVKDAEKFLLSLRARGKGKVNVALVADGQVLAQKDIKVNAKNWKKFDAQLQAKGTANEAQLVITTKGEASLHLDFISLFPKETFKGRKNGLRADLAQTLADLHPRFVRFPGGCVAHGDGIDNIYDWKGSIGELEARRPLRNLWGYHQTRGLGYYEFFLFCEDMGAEPLPVLAAGVPCQNSGTAAHHSHDALTTLGQQCGVPMEEMDAYIQDVLDLIEYANGDVKTTWGAKRAGAGHPKPFNLKMIGIGNEDMITEVFESRFKMITEAVQAKYPEIEVVGTVGPFYEGSDYEAGWRLAKEMNLPCVDEHYYVSPGWMIYNQDYYDGYQRDATKVYLGEYAAHLSGRQSNIETALAEALYLTSVEKNADVVEMTSYAPLLSKDNHTQWRPDLIYFNNTEVRPTVDYEVQKMFGEYAGDKYVPAQLALSTDDEKAKVRVGCSTVFDSAEGCYVFKLVNLLPTSVDASIDVKDLGLTAQAQAVGIVGNPADEKAAEFTLTLPVESTLKCQLPPYSFTVIKAPVQSGR